MTYETVASFVQQGGSIYFLILFLIGLGYAVWPRNREAFGHAKQIPLDEEDDNV